MQTESADRKDLMMGVISTAAIPKRLSVNSQMKKGLIPAHDKDENVEKDYPFEPILDNFESEKEILQRYHDIYRMFITRGLLNPLSHRFTQADVGKNIQGTILDFSTCYATQGAQCFEEHQTNLQYVVLQASLVLTITFPYYVEPGLSKDSFNHAFSFLMGLAALSHVIVIIVCSINTAAIAMAFNDTDTFYFKIRQDLGGVTTTIQVFNYLAMIAALAGMLVAGFDRNNTDGALIALLAIPTVMCLFAFFIWSISNAAILQDERAYLFYTKYCKDSGHLKDKYVAKLYDQEDHSTTTKTLEVLEKLLVKLDK